MYKHTPIRNSYPYVQILSLGEEGFAVLDKTSLERLEIPLEQTWPLFESHCSRLRNRLSVSKTSKRRQCFWSIKSWPWKENGPFFPLSLSLSWPFHELWGLLGGELRAWEHRVKEKALLINRTSRGSATSNASPSGTLQHWGRQKPFSTRVLCFPSKASCDSLFLHTH